MAITITMSVEREQREREVVSNIKRQRESTRVGLVLAASYYTRPFASSC